MTAHTRYEAIGHGYAQLRRDDPRLFVSDGTWDARHGALRALNELDVGLRLIVAR